MNNLSVCAAIFLFIAFLCAFSRERFSYNNPNDVYYEFQNVYKNAQPKNFKIMTTTPTLSQLENGEVVILKSNPDSLIFREGQKLHYIQAIELP